MVLSVLTALYILLIITVVVVILVDRGDSGSKFAWLLIIGVLPLFGVLLYFLFGINYRHHWIFNRRHQKSIDTFLQGTDENLNRILFGHQSEGMIRDEYRPLAAMMGRGAYPTVTAGNSFEIITSGHRKFDLLMKDILQARESIHFEYFHFGDDEGSRAIRRALMQKAREGVKVRFIYENVANFPIRSRYYDDMKQAGVEIVRFTNPRMHFFELVTALNYRNHRKIVVIDGRIGYTGGMNINDRYFKFWRDTHLRITGDAVASLQYTFLDSWITGKGKLDRPLLDFYPMAGITDGNSGGRLMQIVPDEPDRSDPILLYSYEWAIHHAKKYIWFQTPYFVPPEPILDALKIAALCGVDVRIMVPERADNIITRPANRAYYEEVLKAGVRIFLRQGEFIHAKTFVSDDYLSSIGTANMDRRSFHINYEVNSYIYDEPTALECRAIFEKDIEKSRELTIEEWSRRPWYNRLLESVIRLFSPLL